MPTTDEVQLNGLPFVRAGSQTNDLAGGVEARLTKFTDLNSRYELTWVDFDNDETVLTGRLGQRRAAPTSTHRLQRAHSAGAEYSIRFADLNEGTRSMMFHDAGGLLNYALGRAHHAVRRRPGYRTFRTTCSTRRGPRRTSASG